MIDAALNDSLCRATWRSRPGGFLSLMTLYESNYIRLHQLLGDLLHLPDAQVSNPPDDCPLHVRVDERSRYTTTITLTYQFVEGESLTNDPDLQIRIYHDARLGEALRCLRWRRHPLFTALQTDARQESRRELDERWQRNIMLNKWLDYCVERGHFCTAR